MDSTKNLEIINILNDIKEESLSYFRIAEYILKLIRLKNALRNIFKTIGNNNSLSEEILKEGRESLLDLGSPFNLFSELLISQEFKIWFKSLKIYLLESITNEGNENKARLNDLINHIDVFRDNKFLEILNPNPYFKHALDFGINSSKLINVLKEILFPTVYNPDTYQSEIVDKLDLFFEDLDWELLRQCISNLKIAYCDLFENIKNNFHKQTPDNLYNKWIPNQPENLQKYFKSAKLLRELRNVIIHPPPKTDPNFGTWYYVINPKGPNNKPKSPLSKEVLFSPLGILLWNKNPPIETLPLKNILDYSILKIMMEAIKAWINEIIENYELSY